MRSPGGFDELGGDPQPLAGAAHAALEDVAHAQFPGHLPDVDRAALVGERRIARDYREGLEAAERRDDVLDNAIGKIVLLDIGADVLERQHRDRRRIGKTGHQARGWRRTPVAVQAQAVGMHRPRDVLERLFAHVLEG